MTSPADFLDELVEKEPKAAARLRKARDAIVHAPGQLVLVQRAEGDGHADDGDAPPPGPAPGAGAPPDWRAEVDRLAALPPIEADREMEAAATKLGCLLSTLRREVQQARGGQTAGDALGLGQPLTLPERPPWPRPVDGAPLLDALDAALERHVVMAGAARRVVVLWVVFVYLLDCFEHAPRLRIKSPVKRCGKSSLLDYLLETCCRPLPVTNVTGPALFRTVELVRPTLLIDEADTFMRDNEELRGLVNSGHRRSLAFVLRTVEIEGQHEPRSFSTWCAMAIASIGDLPATIEDRSFVVELRRKLPGERTARFDPAARQALNELGGKAARWAADHAAALRKADPAVPDGLHDRAADNWRPLFAIADAAGGAWPNRAREAALTLSEVDAEDGLAVGLLADARNVFASADVPGAEPVDKLPSTRIVGDLVKLEHRPWPEMPGTGKPLTTRKLAVLLARFGIAPKHEGKGNVYLRDRFADAWGRYLPPEEAVAGHGKPAGDTHTAPNPLCEPSTLQESSNGAGFAENETFSEGAGPEGSRNPENPASARVPEGLKVRKGGAEGTPPATTADPRQVDLEEAIAAVEAAERPEDVGDASSPSPAPERKARRGGRKGGTRPGALPLPDDLGAWRKKLGETLPSSRAVVVREWVRSLGGAVDAAGRVSRLPELGPGPVRDALLASIGHYGVAVAETEPGAPT